MKINDEVKEKISYVFAGFALVMGFGLTVAGFIVSPVGEIHESVLWVLGQCLIFAAATLGLALQVHNMKNNMKTGLTSIRNELLEMLIDDKQKLGEGKKETNEEK